MAAQPGNQLLLKTGDGSSPQVFTTVGGMRTSSLSLNAEAIDISDGEGPSSAMWRAILEGFGQQTMAVSGSGVFKDSTSDELIRSTWKSQSLIDMQLVIPEFGVFEGPFKITALVYTGEHAGALQFDMSLESAGELTWAAD